MLDADGLCTLHISGWWLWLNQVFTASKRCLCLCACVCFMDEKLQDVPLSRPTETWSNTQMWKKLPRAKNCVNRIIQAEQTCNKQT